MADNSSVVPTSVVAFVETSTSSNHVRQVSSTMNDNLGDVFAQLKKQDDVDENASVRPSVVVNMMMKKTTNSTPALMDVTNQQNKKTTTVTNNKKNNNDDDDEVDWEAVQALLAALSFSPSEDSLDGEKKQFVFDSPVKNDAAAAPTTPWANQKRVQKTPPTATTTTYDDDDDEAEEDDDDSRLVVTPSPEKHLAGASLGTSTTTNSGNHHDDIVSPLRDPSIAVAAAYPLSLPKDIIQAGGDDSTTVVSSVSSPQARRSSNGNNKPCKKFPKVSTDIPGAGVLRSSMSLKKGAVKLPFVHIAAAATEESSSPRSLTIRRKSNGMNNADVALHVYGAAKTAWGWSKDHVILFRPFMGMAEGVVSMAAGGDDLETVDHHLVTPLVAAVDDIVLNPVTHCIGGFLNGLLGGGGGNHHHESNDTRN